MTCHRVPVAACLHDAASSGGGNRRLLLHWREVVVERSVAGNHQPAVTVRGAKKLDHGISLSSGAKAAGCATALVGIGATAVPAAVGILPADFLAAALVDLGRNTGALAARNPWAFGCLPADVVATLVTHRAARAAAVLLSLATLAHLDARAVGTDLLAETAIALVDAGAIGTRLLVRAAVIDGDAGAVGTLLLAAAALLLAHALPIRTRLLTGTALRVAMPETTHVAIDLAAHAAGRTVLLTACFFGDAAAAALLLVRTAAIDIDTGESARAFGIDATLLVRTTLVFLDACAAMRTLEFVVAALIAWHARFIRALMLFRATLTTARTLPVLARLTVGCDALTGLAVAAGRAASGTTDAIQRLVRRARALLAQLAFVAVLAARRQGRRTFLLFLLSPNLAPLRFGGVGLGIPVFMVFRQRVPAIETGSKGADDAPGQQAEGGTPVLAVAEKPGQFVEVCRIHRSSLGRCLRPASASHLTGAQDVSGLRVLTESRLPTAIDRAVRPLHWT